MGCWKSKSPVKLTKLEGNDKRLDKQDWKKRDDAVNKCYLVAKDMGYELFGVGGKGQCWGGAGDAYKAYGPAKSCPDNGKGYYKVVNVYIIDHPSTTTTTTTTTTAPTITTTTPTPTTTEPMTTTTKPITTTTTPTTTTAAPQLRIGLGRSHCKVTGDFSCCSGLANPRCGEGEGDCDSDEQCAGDLICGVDNCGAGWGSTYDCCAKPILSGRPACKVTGDSGCCNGLDNPRCGEGEGDCDSDEQCAGDLICGVDNCGAGWGSTYDCCAKPATKVAGH